jgi:hypothetical protein
MIVARVHARRHPASAHTRPAQVDGLAQELARSQVELARRRADAGDFRDAMRQAERALKIDPTNKDAQQIFTTAEGHGRQGDQAAAAARKAALPGTTPGAEPPSGPSSARARKPAADDVVTKLESSFRACRRGAARHDRRAPGRGRLEAGHRPRHVQGRRGAGAPGRGRVQGGRFATAARRFLTARERFERALRTAR